MEQKLASVDRRIKVRSRDERDVDASEESSAGGQSRKRKKSGGVQLGSVFVNVNDFENESEKIDDSPAKSPNMALQNSEKMLDDEDNEISSALDKRQRIEEVQNQTDRKRKGHGPEHRAAKSVLGSSSVHFRGVSYNATTAEVKDFLGQCGNCPVLAIRWPNSRDKNCGSVSNFHQFNFCVCPAAFTH